MPIFNNILAGASGQGDTGYDIDQSLRFDHDSSSRLTKTFSSSGNRKINTLSFWIKPALSDTRENIFAAAQDDNNRQQLYFFNNTLRLFGRTSGSSDLELYTNQVFRDPSAWYHIVISMDSTQSTAANRVKIYVNGEQVTSFSTETYWAQDYSGWWASDKEHSIATDIDGGSYAEYFGGYLAEVHFIDGQALTPASFGETNSDTNQWVPIDAKDDLTYGTNGFYEKFSATELANSFTDDSGGYLVPAGVTEVEVLVVAGGGGGSGGGSGGAGGGAGGLVYISNYAVTPGERLDVTIGAGGSAGGPGGQGGDGGNSVFSGITAIGGGGGGEFTAGRNGGSGGGGWASGSTAGGSSTQTTTNDGYTSTGWGNAGGQGGSGTPNQSGGGGGAGAAGVAGKGSGGITSIPTGGNGGIGRAYTIADGSTSVYYAGGGGGGVTTGTDTGQGGSGGGGTGGYGTTGSYTEPTAGTANTGGGGGGGRNDGGGASGGSGIVIIYDGTTRTTFTSSTAPHTITANGDVANVRGTNLGTTYAQIDSFTSTGSATWTCPSGVTSVEVLVVAGGGGGGNHYYGGGGGAGGVVHDATYAVTPGTVYDLSVGAGGASQTNGTNSVFNINGEGTNTTVLTANGGGRGGEGAGGGAQQTGSAGGSGGGGAGYGSPNAGGSSNQTSPTGATGYGNAGGTSSGDPGAGGGGAGAAGSAGSSGSGGAGGAGREFSTFSSYGASGYFGGGGGGAAHPTSGATGGAGGQGGGGAGGKDGVNPVAGTANTGGGGGGTTYHDIPSGAAGGSGVILIAYNKSKPGGSSIKFDGTGDYLTVPDSDDWDFGTGDFTVEHWFRPRSIPSSDTHTTIFSGTSWPPGFRFYYDDSAVPYFRVEGSAYAFTGVTLSANTWYHMAASRQGTNLRLFINGDLKATHTDSTNINSSGVLYIARRGDTTADDANVYLDEIRISNTARYTSSFTPSTTAFTADSNTKLLIHSDFDGGLGADSSGNKNDFSATNLVATDQVLDSPTNNFCTLNSLNLVTNTTLSEGNLKADCTSSNDGAALGTMAVSSGKWYWEVLQTTANANNDISCGVMELSRKMAPQAVGGDVYPNSYLYGNDGWNAKHNSTTSTINTYGAGDIIGWALDLDGNTLKIYKNNSLEYTYSSGVSGTFTPLAAVDGTSGQSVTHIANFGQDSSFNGEKTAQGNGGDGEDFYYTPPTGFKALNTNNLSDPSIADPTDHFATTLYTGDGNSTQSISTEGNFDPEFAWVKIRSGSWGADNHVLYDIVRGDGKRLQSNTTGAESDLTSYGNQVAFATGGITVGSTNSGYNGQVNENSNLYVNWNWKAGGTASSNSDGSITSSVSANTNAGFSIVSWTGNLTSNTIGHGLSQAPELIIVKDRDGVRGWPSNIENVTGTSNQYLLLNASDSAATSSAYWGAAPGASTFTVGDSGNTNSASAMIAYCFHSVDGYSKVGTYEGNANADGPFVYTGFRPAFIMLKGTIATVHWHMFDSARYTYNETDNGVNGGIAANLASMNSGEGAGPIDIVSNGFKIRNANGNDNNNGTTFIYLAFAELPFKYSNAR